MNSITEKFHADVYSSHFQVQLDNTDKLLNCWLHRGHYLHCHTKDRNTPNSIFLLCQKAYAFAEPDIDIFAFPSLTTSLCLPSGDCVLCGDYNSIYLSDDDRANGDDLRPLFPEQNETLEPVHAAGEPQTAALVEGEVQGHGEEGGGQGVSVSVSLRLHAVVGEVVVEVLAEFVAPAWKKRKIREMRICENPLITRKVPILGNAIYFE